MLQTVTTSVMHFRGFTWNGPAISSLKLAAGYLPAFGSRDWFWCWMAVFGGYLLLSDVNRDVRMTEVRSQFIASVSHELKTPLTAIRMFAETLAMGRSRDENTRAEYL